MAGSTRFFNRPRGRFFSVKDERRRIDGGLRDFQAVYGTVIDWYFFVNSATTMDDIYDEGLVTGGKRYDGPMRLPVLSAVTAQGDEQADDQGFATYDRVTLRVSYEQARKVGLTQNLTQSREAHLLDRFVFRNRVFEVETIQTSGHFEATASDTVFRVVGIGVRQDELLDSPDFAKYSG